MLSVNSNCSRVDAVKAAANLLDLQSTAANSGANSPANPAAATTAAHKVKSDLQTVNSQVKIGNAQAAEIALATAKKDVQAAELTPKPSAVSQNDWTLDAYA